MIGHSNVATNRVTIPVEVNEYKDIPPISFNASMFSNALSANKECQKAVLKVSSQGIATIKFSIDDYTRYHIYGEKIDKPISKANIVVAPYVVILSLLTPNLTKASRTASALA